MISNTNGYIKWTKTNCNEYSIENLTDYEAVLTVTSDTNTFTSEITIEANDSAELVVPSDGIYKICADGYSTEITVNDTQVPIETESYIAVYSFVDTSPSAFVQHADSDGSVVYDEGTHGAADTSSPTNFNTQMSTYYGATGYELIPAGATPTVFTWLPVDATNWRVVYKVSINFLTPSAFNYIRIRSAVDGSTFDYEPVLYRTHTFAGYTAGFNYLTNFVIGTISSDNLLSAPTAPFNERYDLSSAADVSQFKLHAETYLDNNSTTGYFYEDGSDYTFAILNSANNITEFSYSDLTIVNTDIQWCDYLYELCALHDCIIKKLNDYLCTDCDPCEKTCDQDILQAQNKAKSDLYYVSTLFFHGLVPLITADRLNYMGDLVIDDDRIDCSMKIKELYEKLVDFVTRCGECEDDCEDCNCNCIQNTTSKCNNC